MSYVQSTTVDGGGPPASLAATFASAQTAGDLNVVVITTISTNSGAFSTPTDTKGNTYHLAASYTVQGNNIWIYYAWNIASAGASANTVTVSGISGGDFWWVLMIAEYSGVQKSSDPLHVHGTNNNNFGSSATPNVTLAPAPTDTVVIATAGGTTPLSGVSPMTMRENDNVAGTNVVLADGPAGSTTNFATNTATTLWTAVATAFKALGLSVNAVFFGDNQ